MDVSVPQIINAYAVHPDTRRVHCIKLTWRTDHEPRPGDWKADEPMMTDDGYILDAVAERPSTAVEMAFDRLIEQLLSELSAIACSYEHMEKQLSLTETGKDYIEARQRYRQRSKRSLEGNDNTEPEEKKNPKHNQKKR